MTAPGDAAGNDMEATMTEHLEIEQKFDVSTGFTIPDLAAVPGCAAVGEPATHHLSATYYDTSGNRLAASKITLRRRTGGTDEGWHLKLPAGQHARREIHAPLAPGDEAQVPEELASQVAAVTGGLPLAPIAFLHTERTVLTLLHATGRVLAEVADDVVTARREGTAGESLRWREVEVEVPEDSADTRLVLEGTAQVLLAAGAVPAASGSKLARLLGS
ncbi:MAG: domain containing protein [Actinomycetia bacterium]|nr:domain containing protein [Actinomycetes bacterium]